MKPKRAKMLAHIGKRVMIVSKCMWEGYSGTIVKFDEKRKTFTVVIPCQGCDVVGGFKSDDLREVWTEEITRYRSLDV